MTILNDVPAAIEFEIRMRTQLPEFQLITNEPNAAPIGLLYRWQATSPLTFYLQIIVDASMECFTLELGWSKNDIFPPVTLRGLPEWVPMEQNFVLRLGRFWDRKEGQNLTWPLTPDAVDEVFVKIETHALPYFQDIADHFKVPIPEFSCITAKQEG